MAAWLEKAFPNTKVIKSTGADRISSVEGGGQLVIATPGAEPSIPGGYSVVVLADAANMLGIPKLRAMEISCLFWANAIAKTNKDGLVVFVGIGESLESSLSKLDFYSVVATDYADRKDLQLPPFTRIGSLEARNPKSLESLVTAMKDRAPHIRFLPQTASSQIGFNYQYSTSRELTEILKSSLTSITLNSKESKNIRPIKVRMDDFNII